ncbi:hypothetical protein B0H12DRAFT_1079138 [Mycena haematopus]|nr:hypothetical protein B0H12DRAFT_1079138 [Mycena haematopus]
MEPDHDGAEFERLKIPPRPLKPTYLPLRRFPLLPAGKPFSTVLPKAEESPLTVSVSLIFGGFFWLAERRLYEDLRRLAINLYLICPGASLEVQDKVLTPKESLRGHLGPIWDIY